jgi:hypothetical protein
MLAILVALGLAGAATAAGTYTWTEDEAIGHLLDDDTMFELGVVDGSCDGWGAPRVGTDGRPSFKRFVCKLAAEGTDAWGDEQTCTIRVRLIVVNPIRYRVVSLRNSCGQGY